MWKLIFLIIVATSITHASDHLLSAKLKYPYSLIGDDLGVLTEQDLALNTCNTNPEPFSEKIAPFSYWKCFETKDVHFLCEGGFGTDPHEGIMTLMVLKVLRKGQDGHKYIAHRPWPIRECMDSKKDFRSLTNRTKNICISGEFIETDIDRNGARTSSWMIDKYRTSKGCRSYYGGRCTLDRRAKRECKFGLASPGT